MIKLVELFGFQLDADAVHRQVLMAAQRRSVDQCMDYYSLKVGVRDQCF